MLIYFRLSRQNWFSVTFSSRQKYASDKKHFYRHDRINRGICMDRCIAQMKRFDYDTRMKYYLPKFDNDSEIAYDPDVFTNALVDRAQFTKFAAMCVNYDLHKNYGLMAQSDIVYCIRSYDDYFAVYGTGLENTFLTRLSPFAITYFLFSCL